MGLQLAVRKLSEQKISFLESPTEVTEIIEDCQRSCETAVEILNEILTYDKLEAGDMKLNFAPISVKQLIEKNVNPFRVHVSIIE